MQSEIILVRHAQSLRRPEDGPDDVRTALTAVGIAQAERLIAELSQITPSLIASSPSLRAVHTVEPFARAVGMPITTSHDLRAWDSGIDVTPDRARHYAESWANPYYARPNAESLCQLTDRATTILRSLAEQYPNGTIVIGSHGIFICRALVGLGLTMVDWPFSQAMPMPAIYSIHFTDHEIRATGPGL